jgi:toxin ParE1/3/4
VKGKRASRQQAVRPPLRRRHPIVWTERALSDLDAIADFIADENRGAAERWAAKLIAVAGTLATTPLAGRRVPEFSRDDLREILVRSYRIVYRVTATRCEILTIFEGRRLFPRDVAPDVEE